MKTFTYIPRGVCSRRIDISLEGDTVLEVAFTGGCSGNTQGIAALVSGRQIDDVIARVEGIRCGFKQTDCGSPRIRAG